MKLLLILFALRVGWSACTPDAQRFAEAKAAYYDAADGQRERMDVAAKLFSEMHAACPTDARVMAYQGSVQLFEASHTWALWRKNSLSKEGITAMDAAVASAPDNLEVRFVRAATTYNLPSFFHRRQQSADDFSILAREAEAGVRNGRFEARLAAASLYFHAEFLHEKAQNRQAVDAWKLAIRVAPQSRAARDSANELKKLE